MVVWIAQIIALARDVLASGIRAIGGMPNKHLGSE